MMENSLRTIILVLLVFMTTSCQQKKGIPKNGSDNKGLTFNHHDSLITFDRNKIDLDSIRIILNMDKVNLLGSMTKNENTILLVYGDRTDETYREQTLFLCSTGLVFHNDSIKSSRFSLPGNQYNMFDSLVYQSRVFFGDCTNKFPFSIVWFQKERQNNHNWQTSYYVITPDSKDQFSSRLKDNAIDLNEILSNIQTGKCKEIPGLEIYIEP
jgi:hypothetical protein